MGRRGDEGRHRPGRPLRSPAAHADGAARSASGASVVPRASAEPAGDPRSAAVPADPPAGVPDPACTRSADEDQPTDAEWAAGATAGTARTEEAAACTGPASVVW
ncbi:hypothetical protein ACF1B0_07255 [Streptomyces anandii]|uniref:hypothetical protein n=1 Tax=Streptomyces anandii TaxID=285454 RepID=UPI0037003E32